MVKKISINKTFLQFINNKKALGGCLIIFVFTIIAIFAPLFSPYDPYKLMVGEQLQPPSIGHLFGTDYMGRDVFSRALYGTRISLSVAIMVGIISAIIGIVIGLSSAYFGGIFDMVAMRLVDIIMSIPWVMVALLLVSIISPGIKTVVISLGIVYSPAFVRLVRSKAMSTSKEIYVIAAEALGESKFSIMTKYILMNCIGPILVQFTLTMSWSIIGESGISYLGYGTQPPTPSWGLMLADSTRVINSAPITLSILPGILILVVVVGFNFLGDGLRDLFDPKSRNV